MASERRQVKVTRNGNSNDRKSTDTKTLKKIYKGRFQYLSLLAKEIKFELRDMSLSRSHISIGDASRTLLILPWVEYMQLFDHVPGRRARPYSNLDPDSRGLTTNLHLTCQYTHSNGSTKSTSD